MRYSQKFCVKANPIRQKTACKARSVKDERNQLHNAGRLQPVETNNAKAGGGELGLIRSDEEKIPQVTLQSSFLQSYDELHFERSFEC